MDPIRIGDATFYNEDCVEGARKRLADGSVDLVVTDPPYGIEGDRLHRHYNRDESFVTDGYVEVPAAAYAEFSRAWVREAARVLRPGGAAFVVSGWSNLYDVLGALRASGLREVNHLVWKFNFGVFTRRKFVSSHYHVLYWAKPGGERTFDAECRFGLAERTPDGGSANYRDREDVWTIPREYKPGRAKNKNELPTELLAKILQYASRPGDVVADLFLGGFSTARVAVGLGRRFVGFEVSPTIFRRGVEAFRDVEPGALLPTLRVPVKGGPARQGEAWTEAERRRLATRYRALVREGRTKKDAFVVLQEEFGRGRWALEKALKRA